MTPTTKRGAVALADKTEDRIPSLAADLASLSPLRRRKARKALVAMGKLAVPSLIRLLLHRKPHVRWNSQGLGGIADPLAAPRWSMPWTTAMATCVGLRPRVWPLWAERGCNLCWRHCSSGLNHVGFARARTMSVTLSSRREAGPDSTACIGGPERIRAGSCGAAGRLYRAIETARVVVRTRQARCHGPPEAC